MEPRPLRSPPAPLTGNQDETAVAGLVLWGAHADHEQLHQALRANRIGQLAQSLLIEALPRVVHRWQDFLDGAEKKSRRATCGLTHLRMPILTDHRHRRVFW